MWLRNGVQMVSSRLRSVSLASRRCDRVLQRGRRGGPGRRARQGGQLGQLDGSFLGACHVIHTCCKQQIATSYYVWRYLWTSWLFLSPWYYALWSAVSISLATGNTNALDVYTPVIPLNQPQDSEPLVTADAAFSPSSPPISSPSC